jgi:hypothetical protein
MKALPPPISQLISGKVRWALLRHAWHPNRDAIERTGAKPVPMPREASPVFARLLEALAVLSDVVGQCGADGRSEQVVDALVAIAAAHEQLVAAWAKGRVEQPKRTSATRARRRDMRRGST